MSWPQMVVGVLNVGMSERFISSSRLFLAEGASPSSLASLFVPLGL